MYRSCVAVVLLFFALPVWAAEPIAPVTIKEWQDPLKGHSRDPFAVSAQEVWFVGQRGDYLARLDPTNGKFFHRQLNDGAGPHNLIVDRRGIVWYSGNLRGYIGRYDPKSDKIDKIRMPARNGGDPHTLVFDRGQKNIWFTAQHGNAIGRLNLRTRDVKLVNVTSRSSRPYGIIVAPSGIVWSALFGTNKLASVDPETLRLTEYALPSGARPRRLGATGDGNIYYVDYRRGRLGRLDPKTKAIREWPMPSGEDAQPYGMAIDHENRIWFVETGSTPNLFVGFDPKTEKYFSITKIPSGAGSVRHMHYHQPTKSVWFGTDEDTVGQAVVFP